MKSKIFILFLCTLFFLSIACKKSDTIVDPPVVCDVRGTYTFKATTSTGDTSTTTYKLQDNNFVVGSLTPTSAAITFGGYKNNCDSVFMSVYISVNASYYSIEGKLLNNATSVEGTFKNLKPLSVLTFKGFLFFGMPRGTFLNIGSKINTPQGAV